LLRASTDASRIAGADSALDALDARVLLCHVLNWPRTALITRADQPLVAEAVRRFEALVARRRAGEPIAQLVGEREFFGRPFAVTPDVLIPRPDTELLVELALAYIDRRFGTALASAPLNVLDLGTGSGAIAVTLAAERPGIAMWGSDRSAAALAVAAQNALALLPIPHRGVRFLQGDWFEALAGAESIETGEMRNPRRPTASANATRAVDTPAITIESFDLIVSNPPYIATDDPHLAQGDLRFEPRGALTDGGDGLGDIRTLVHGAGRWLRNGAALMIEHGYDQGAAVRAIFEQAAYIDVRTERDLGGQERVTAAIWRGTNDTDRRSNGPLTPAIPPQHA